MSHGPTDKEREKTIRMLASDEWHSRMVDNLMAGVRDWVIEKGGATGELHLRKRYDNEQKRWIIEMVQIHPTSTWMLGS